MDKAYIDRHLVTDRYLQGTLSEREVAEFEERLTWDTELLDELQLAEQLRDGLREAAASGLQATRATTPGIFSRIWYVPQYAAAASFLLAVALTYVVMLNAPRNMPETSFPDTEIVPLVAVRSTAAARIPVRADAVTVLLVDAADGYPAYHVELRSEGHDSDLVWEKSGLLPTYPESVAVSLPPGFLPPGRYVLQIEGELTNASGDVIYEAIREIPFEAYAVTASQ